MCKHGIVMRNNVFVFKLPIVKMIFGDNDGNTKLKDVVVFTLQLRESM